MFKTIQPHLRAHSLNFALAALIVAISISVLSPGVATATIETGPKPLTGSVLELSIKAMQNESRPYGNLPEALDREVYWIVHIPITAYASVPEQTDSTPFITASGKHVRDGIVAANFLPMGTRVRIPALYGNKIFVVEDRMNKRYFYRMDIWMAENNDAKKFGLKRTTVEILKK